MTLGVGLYRPAGDPHEAHKLAAEWCPTCQAEARADEGSSPGEKADPSFASAPGPLDPAAALNHAISESIAMTPPRKKRK
jgi:hypothetical protein